MSEPEWLLKETIITLHAASIAEHGGLPGIRDASLLDSALSRPKNKQAYAAEPSIPSLAAAYSYGLARNHPFSDGNKRIALIAALTFLDVNGCVFDAARDETLHMYLALAAGDLEEDDLARWIEANSIPDA